MLKKFLLTALFIIGGLLLLESALDVDHECRFDDFDEYVEYQQVNGSFNTQKFNDTLKMRNSLYSKYYRQCKRSIK